MDYEIKVYKRPDKEIALRIREIAELLTERWFTANVPEDTERDLMFQDAACLSVDGSIVSFIMFTCLDGTINISLMGTHPGYRGRGLGSILIKYFFDYTRKLDFDEIRVFTVPPDAKPAYKETVEFYEKHGFRIIKRYTELWEKGAIELRKEL